MPEIRRIAQSTEHRVSTGETLEGIAQAHGVTVQELAQFNWGTSDPAEIDDRLRRFVGASQRSPESQFLVFNDADDPGILLLPREFHESGLETDRLHTIRVKKAEPQPLLLTCTGFPGNSFPFDSSFIGPSVGAYVRKVETLVEQMPQAKLLVFGHTDRCGPEMYNKKLSERRAKSAFAFVTRQPAIWEQLYQEERWGAREIQEILANLGHDSGPIDGLMGPLTEQGMRSFLGLPEFTPVSNDLPFRLRLFEAYMDSKQSSPIGQERFIGPKFMGCGEFNPIVAPNEFERANRGRGVRPGNPPNRRVIFYLFSRPPSHIPCQFENLAPCRAEFAKPLPERPGSFYRCAFYHRLGSLCHWEARGADTSSQSLSILIDRVGFKAGLPEQYTLRSDDGEYEVTKAQRDAREFDEEYMVLTFEDVPADKRYSVTHHHGARAQYTVFASEPFEKLTDKGPGASDATYEVADEAETEPLFEPEYLSEDIDARIGPEYYNVGRTIDDEDFDLPDGATESA